MGPASMPAQPTGSLDHPLEFADYDLVRRLGRGGMGEVWSAVRRGPCEAVRPLAIKVMHPELSGDDYFCEIFVRECRISMQLSSSNIVPVFELGRCDGLLFMVMERIDGVNLSDFQRRSRNVHSLLPLDVVAFIIGEILSALFVAHEHIVTKQPAGVIHRDIKPGNVLISSTGDVRLIDFGIARPLIRDASRQMPIGTWRYMAPEQARGYTSRASDLFAVGVILHELLSGTPFRPPGLSNEQYYRLVTDYAMIPALERVIAPELERLRRGLLEPDPERRFSSAADAMESLYKCPGHRFSRLMLARIYETAIGIRSSGFTDAHKAAPPSFLLRRKSSHTDRKGEVAVDNTVIFRRPGASEQSPFVADDIDEDAKTMLRRPWLGRALWMNRRGVPPERQRPERLAAPAVIARPRRDEGGPHPAADEPPSPTQHETDGGASKPRAITPTLRLLLPVDVQSDAEAGRGSDPRARRKTEIEVPCRERDAPGETNSASGSIDASERSSPASAPPAGKSAQASVAARRPGTRSALSVLVVVVLAAITGAAVSWAIYAEGSSTVEGSP